MTKHTYKKSVLSKLADDFINLVVQPDLAGSDLQNKSVSTYITGK